MDVIKFLLTKGVDCNRQTVNNDHTPLSLGEYTKLKFFI